tara:strand:+ start:317 stop:775 length:459 start_codon:yes stop_codon:yes gene_type:complete
MVNEYAAHNYGHGEETASWSWSHAKGRGKMHDMVEAQHADREDEIEAICEAIPDFKIKRKPVRARVQPTVTLYVHANIRERCPHAPMSTIAGRLHVQIDDLVLNHRPNPLDFREQVIILARNLNPVAQTTDEFEFEDGSVITVTQNSLWSFS